MEKSSFFNSVNHDRVYTAQDFAAFYGDLFTNGVVYDSDDALRVAANGGFSLVAHAGSAWINGYRYFNTGNLELGVGMPSGLPRIDRVAVRWDSGERRMYLVVLEGAPSASPQPPQLTRTDTIYELGLCDVNVPPNALAIEDYMLVDQRLNPSVGGMALSKAYLHDGGAAAETIMEYVYSIENALKSGVYSPMPNYAAQETENLFLSPGYQWTADRDGFVHVDACFTLYAGSDLAAYGMISIRINGKNVALQDGTVQGTNPYSRYAPLGVSGVFPISVGDVVSYFRIGSSAGNFTAACYFIPRLITA